MELIKPTYQIWKQGSGLDGIYKHIERAGRVCYKSEDKITEDSAKPFVDRMTKSKHLAMLEHGTVYLMLYRGTELKDDIVKFFEYNPYSRVVVCDDDKSHAYITTNLRVLAENDCMSLLQYMCEPTEYHDIRLTVHFTLDRGVSHEFVRHRVMSFAQESTRYCNYAKDKFGGSVTFIAPLWATDEELKEIDNDLSIIEQMYFKWLNKGWTPQQARFILPNALKTELVMTGFYDDWEHFFDLRALGTTGKPHPQAQELAEPLMKEMNAIIRSYYL